jgi:uncharacterized spore protein YtfJ
MLSSSQSPYMEDSLQPTQPTQAEDLVLSLSEKLAATASSHKVYGEPIHAHDRTIVPVAKVRYGVGATSGGRDGDTVGGGSGGGGVSAAPAGYIEITAEGTRYTPIATPHQILIAALAGLTFGYLLGRSRR